jgi:hypothetical protein
MPNISIRFTPNTWVGGLSETEPFPHAPLVRDTIGKVLNRFSLPDEDPPYVLGPDDPKAAGAYDHTLPRNKSTIASIPPPPGTALLTVIAQEMDERNGPKDENLRVIGRGVLADTVETLATHGVQGVDRVQVHLVAGHGYLFERILASDQADEHTPHPDGIPMGLPTPPRENQLDVICSWGSHHGDTQHSADITPRFVRSGGLRVVNRTIRETVEDVIRKVSGPHLFVNVAHLFNERGVDHPDVMTTDRFARQRVNQNAPTVAMSARAHPSIPGRLIGKDIATGLAVNVNNTLERLMPDADPRPDTYAAFEPDGLPDVPGRTTNTTEYWGAPYQTGGGRYKP